MIVNPGDVLDERFRIDQRIGEGGVGVVFRATDVETGQVVALKIIAANTAEQIRRATQEIELLAQLVHPGIVRHVADGLTDTDQLYLAMEWIDGVTVAERLQGAGFSLREAVALARGVASALGEAHAIQVAHRDIKPSNILLEGGDPGRARLIDFGLARLVGSGYRSVTRTGTTLGTPGYMSPEQARGLRTLTSASDVFGIGVVLYECLTGRPAFTGNTLAALMIDVVLAEPPPLAELCPEAPAALQALVAALLAKDPARRPADGAAVVRALDALGPLPDGPRSVGLADAPAPAPSVHAAPAVALVHCLVLAAHGLVDDILEPPPAADRDRIFEAATRLGAHLEILGTGAVVARFAGLASDTAPRAADLALEIKRALVGWTVTVSTLNADLHRTAEHGTALLARAAKTELFARKRLPDGITIDPETAALLETRYLMLKTTPPRLVGKR